jgi:phosphoglycerate-specific signal transduction histidine kinase
MRLHLTDYHLASARLALLNGDRTQAREHFTKAETLIQETGYHRRDSDLAELRPQCT